MRVSGRMCQFGKRVCVWGGGGGGYNTRTEERFFLIQSSFVGIEYFTEKTVIVAITPCFISFSSKLSRSMPVWSLKFYCFAKNCSIQSHCLFVCFQSQLSPFKKYAVNPFKHFLLQWLRQGRKNE